MGNLDGRPLVRARRQRCHVGALVLQALVLAFLLPGCIGARRGGVAPTSELTPTRTPAEHSVTPATPEVVTQVSAAPTERPQATASPTPAARQSTPTQVVTATTPAAEPAATASPGATQAADCIDQAVFVGDVNVPDGTFFDPGESFTKVWRVRNSGTCDWGSGYALVFDSGDIMNGALTNPMPVVPAGEVADVSLELTAPSRQGPQKGYWLFQNAAGERFGVGVPSSGTLWVMIVVDSYPSNPTPTTAPGEASGTPGSGECPVQRNRGYEEAVLALIEEARAANGLGALEEQDQLSAAALAHSTDMACNGFVDHNGSDGSTWYDRVAAQGYANYASARENIYVGDPNFGGTPQGAFDWWMNSQIHRENILNAGVSQVGIGYVYLAGSPYGGYYTLIFARP